MTPYVNFGGLNTFGAFPYPMDDQQDIELEYEKENNASAQTSTRPNVRFHI